MKFIFRNTRIYTVIINDGIGIRILLYMADDLEVLGAISSMN